MLGFGGWQPHRCSAACLGLQFVYDCFLCEVGKTIHKLFGEKILIFREPVFLRAKGRAFDVLYLELDDPCRNGGDADVEISFH
jgi:hypothetical protein